MKVVVTAPVQIALQTLGEQDRERVRAWIDHLKNWEEDSHVRNRAHKLSQPENTFVLHTTTDIRIFFTLENDTITVLDVAKKPAILTSGHLVGEDGS